MNIALEQTEERVNGVVTNRYGDAFIRGDNGPMASLALLRLDVVLQCFSYPLLNPCEILSLFALAAK
jgi:hypothetical protein